MGSSDQAFARLAIQGWELQIATGCFGVAIMSKSSLKHVVLSDWPNVVSGGFF